MHRTSKFLAIAATAFALSASAFAQYVHHDEWRHGHRLNDDEWNRSVVIDNYRDHPLRRPPAHYEWRAIDGNHVLVHKDRHTISTVVVAR